ncbi:hypothetical protein [Nannocystis sp. SCPEA4]|uniref:hypothetical protein n=1 Tax=Nannocystis sp. SCPEA4 TaxID=2996787 RepID=UPI0022706878|nr:hypothetical protein [Nannocystis sp. SCPEA4]
MTSGAASTTTTAPLSTGSASPSESTTGTSGSASDSGTPTSGGTAGVSDTGNDTDPGPGCDDGVQNGGELGVDCGGPCGSTCEDGQDCVVDGDCVSQFCLDGTCTPDEFTAGSLIIPMDTDYQDLGMLEAYGLVYALLSAGVPVHWIIAPDKPYAGVDVVASAIDLQSGQPIDAHGYRGGPFVVSAADAVDALAVIEGWQQQNPATVVHEVSASFMAPVSRRLVAAPTIAMFADGNQDIARKYMMAAKIPDSTGDVGWPDSSPDMLDPLEVAGPTDSEHRDGALFDADGDPVYCQLMSMHWGVSDAEALPEVVAEVREFLGEPTHFFAECQAVSAFENLASHGLFLTTQGLLTGGGSNEHEFHGLDRPFAQFDGAFESVGGSEPAYKLPADGTYKADGLVMITEQGSPVGVNDVWTTGTLDGMCAREDPGCTIGKVSYLGGHEYDVATPISDHPSSQGTRLFLNSLFEAPCSAASGTPDLTLSKSAPAHVAAPQITFMIDYANVGIATAQAAVLRDVLPDGSSFVAATQGGQLVGDTVTWSLGNLGPGENGSVSVTVDLGGAGVYENVAHLDYMAGLNAFGLDSNVTMTAYP